jgi:hypothetical protein
VVDADANPSFVVADVVNAVGRGAAELGVDEIVDANRLRRSGRPVFPSAILEVADEFLLLRIDGYCWLPSRDRSLNRLGDMPELRIAIDVARAFERLSIALKRVTERLQQRTDAVVTDPLPPIRKSLR